ncbi:MAG: class I SAM-dependent methyltransferase [Cyclobacteriaceae bacterium]|nr:class I SAM-dependent methyltransferase [Cyclobacteriaceae bacterium]
MFEYPEEVYNKRSAKIIFPILIDNLFNFKSIVDFGCGNGSWISAYKEIDRNADILGIDVENYTSNHLIGHHEYIRSDLTKKIALNKTFDLVISLETAEHIDEEYSQIFINNLVSHGELILFSAAIPGQGGINHVNEQWHSYWFEIFKKYGFECYDFRSIIWDNSQIDFWYRQNLLIYSKRKLNLPVLNSSMIDVIHPEMWLYKKHYPNEYLKHLSDGKIGIKNSLNLLLKNIFNY